MPNIEDVDLDEMTDFLYSLVDAMDPTTEQIDRMIEFLENEEIQLDYWKDEDGVFWIRAQKKK